MATTPQYDLLRASITDADHRRAFDFLFERIGDETPPGIADIAAHLYGSRSDNAIRKARDVIEDLRTRYRVPVCSTSGKPGRWLARNDAELQECLADFRARRASIDDVIHALEKATVPPPQVISRQEAAVQQSLF